MPRGVRSDQQLAIPKPEPWKKTKDRRKRAEAEALTTAWKESGDRDGYCRLIGVKVFGTCDGKSEFAHVGQYRRFKTRGMAPTERHKRSGGIRLCSCHHRTGQFAYDANRIVIEMLTPDECDGLLEFRTRDGSIVYRETVGESDSV